MDLEKKKTSVPAGQSGAWHFRTVGLSNIPKCVQVEAQDTKLHLFQYRWFCFLKFAKKEQELDILDIQSIMHKQVKSTAMVLWFILGLVLTIACGMLHESDGMMLGFAVCIVASLFMKEKYFVIAYPGGEFRIQDGIRLHLFGGFRFGSDMQRFFDYVAKYQPSCIHPYK